MDRLARVAHDCNERSSQASPNRLSRGLAQFAVRRSSNTYDGPVFAVLVFVVATRRCRVRSAPTTTTNNAQAAGAGGIGLAAFESPYTLFQQLPKAFLRVCPVVVGRLLNGLDGISAPSRLFFLYFTRVVVVYVGGTRCCSKRISASRCARR
uniref:Uncharacterized protein n=1 Tax=Plectus sambesii TaxID=2011161 RepID=A0A914VEV3_9BILA